MSETNVVSPTTEGSDVERVVMRFYDHRQKNGWLSNFYESIITVDDAEWATVEHYYQAMKHEGTSLAGEVAAQPTARQAKDLARSVWPTAWTEYRKVAVMRKAVFAKFEQNTKLRAALIMTGNAVLIEASPTDPFWGDGEKGDGINMMGLLLMEARAELSQPA